MAVSSLSFCHSRLCENDNYLRQLKLRTAVQIDGIFVYLWMKNMPKTLCNVVVALFTLCFWISFAAASSSSQIYHRDFWYPTYHIERLNYCLIDGKTCGRKVATQYCHLMGYQEARRVKIAYNVGLTHYLATNSACKGWRCNGFKVIECINKIVHKPAAPYYYRSRKFVLPRFDHYRVAWCLEKNKKCGKPAAFSFCRRLGYMKASGFKKENAVVATRAIGSRELCFGADCSGFSEITCYR